MKRVCFGSDCFRSIAGISGVIGSVAFATAALTAGVDGTRSQRGRGEEKSRGRNDRRVKRRVMVRVYLQQGN